MLKAGSELNFGFESKNDQLSKLRPFRRIRINLLLAGIIHRRSIRVVYIDKFGCDINKGVHLLEAVMDAAP